RCHRILSLCATDWRLLLRSHLVTNQVIRPPNPLRAKVGGGFGGIDASAIARAEEALKAMSAQFGQWLNDEVAKLDKAQADIRSQGYSPETAEALYFRAHDLKGLGTTYEYPLVKIGRASCRERVEVCVVGAAV